MSALTRLLSPESIVLDASAADWRDAIQQAGSLLENAGHCTPDYTQSMIDTVAHNGPYIVLTPGLALAHARPSAAVQSTWFVVSALIDAHFIRPPQKRSGQHRYSSCSG